MEEEILRYFPRELGEEIRNTKQKDDLEEIRLRVNLPVHLRCTSQEKRLNYQMTSQKMQEILERCVKIRSILIKNKFVKDM